MKEFIVTIHYRVKAESENQAIVKVTKYNGDLFYNRLQQIDFNREVIEEAVEIKELTQVVKD